MGDFAQAFATHKEFHAAHEAVHAIEREAQARVRHALFETTEAREQARRFREQALRDPLTMLYNRRYVDERLPILLADAARTGAPLIAALLDLDGFKRVNDTLSHDTGDQVLVTVAGLITEALREDELGARLGGEEFLVVLNGAGPVEAVNRLERLRLAVSAYPWRPLTGDLPVTISIGVAVAGPDSTQASLLAVADRHLYAAKHAGRNRVRVDPDALLERRRYRT
jgi:diguanylate cyclase (GGDEF)-like protein